MVVLVIFYLCFCFCGWYAYRHLRPFLDLADDPGKWK
ncbi:virus entry/fusion complex component [Western grey kangaroopox virus]|uniref:Virus entry/fusion complex component n=2 Tax=Macropopoxvirus TaxID=2733295 RepID=A0A2C9DT17_9POXV|nr:virus entry/fusion complex component [Western grey kangaroopox virus]YP_010085340.1 virus entry/fusion complex component [Eastern grey kangaroopox virus]ATI20986.1 virus entry/fusion complex component [Western grey kangaroopox virus]ATI21150.1 virus entry/fusion complex component [Eastern grey kangaroopox virus]ATX75057.1 virus entry/fusion complex component [Eastern grey kangaroopox virus]